MSARAVCAAAAPRTADSGDAAWSAADVKPMDQTASAATTRDTIVIVVLDTYITLAGSSFCRRAATATLCCLSRAPSALAHHRSTRRASSLHRRSGAAEYGVCVARIRPVRSSAFGHNRRARRFAGAALPEGRTLDLHQGRSSPALLRSSQWPAVRGLRRRRRKVVSSDHAGDELVIPS